MNKLLSLSPVGVRTHLHDAPGAALLAFFQLVVNNQLSRLQHRNSQSPLTSFVVVVSVSFHLDSHL